MQVLDTNKEFIVNSANHLITLYKRDFAQLNTDFCIGIKGFSKDDLEQIHSLLKKEGLEICLGAALLDKNQEEVNQYFSRIFCEKQTHVFLGLTAGDEANLEALIPAKINHYITKQDIEKYLANSLLDAIPADYKSIIKNDIISCIEYLDNKKLPDASIIKYLLFLESEGFTAELIGNGIYMFGLLPDETLLNGTSNSTRNKLSINLESVQKLIDNDKPLYDRISGLSVQNNGIQRYLVDFLRSETDALKATDFSALVYQKYPKLNFANWALLEGSERKIALPNEHITPKYDLLLGNSSPTSQYGLVGESFAGRKVAIDLSGTNTISLFGVQGAGKSYTIGTISEMVLKQFSSVSELPNPLAGVIFHYSESMDYEPEFTSMINPNTKENELAKLKKRYGADPGALDDVIIICPKDKVEEKRLEYPSVQVEPIAFNPTELNVQDWMFMLGAMGNDANYVKQLKAIAKKYRKGISIDSIEKDVKSSILFTDFEKGLALQKLDFAREYVDNQYNLGALLKPGRLIIVDLRDEFIDKDEALGLFVVILNIFSAVKQYEGNRFNKFIVFDEAHKYMDNVKLTGSIVTAIREMRHKGVSIMIASQDPPSLPKEIIELSSVVLLHKFNSPQWLNHIKNAITQLEILSPQDMSILSPGEAYIWATKATERSVTYKPLKIAARPRVTQHGGATLQAGGKK